MGKSRTKTHQQSSELPTLSGTPGRLPRGDLAEVVHGFRALDARDELNGRPVGVPNLVRAVGDVYLLRYMMQILGRVDLGENERADPREAQLSGPVMSE